MKAKDKQLQKKLPVHLMILNHAKRHQGLRANSMNRAMISAAMKVRGSNV